MSMRGMKGVITMAMYNLDEICFLFGDESLCKKKCNGHRIGCRTYVRYYPSINKTYGERPVENYNGIKITKASEEKKEENKENKENKK